MMNIVKRFFAKQSADATTRQATGHDIRVAVCALCIEIARIDHRFTQEELDILVALLQDKYDLSKAHIDELMEEANRELEESVDLWQFARLINENYSPAEKMDIMEMLWQIVFVDGKMDAHEHYLMGKLSSLLRLSHDQLIEAKLKVLKPESSSK